MALAAPVLSEDQINEIVDKFLGSVRLCEPVRVAEFALDRDEDPPESFNGNAYECSFFGSPATSPTGALDEPVAVAPPASFEALCEPPSKHPIVVDGSLDDPFEPPPSAYVPASTNMQRHIYYEELIIEAPVINIREDVRPFSEVYDSEHVPPQNYEERIIEVPEINIRKDAPLPAEVCDSEDMPPLFSNEERIIEALGTNICEDKTKRDKGQPALKRLVTDASIDAISADLPPDIAERSGLKPLAAEVAPVGTTVSSEEKANWLGAGARAIDDSTVRLPLLAKCVAFVRREAVPPDRIFEVVSRFKLEPREAIRLGFMLDAAQGVVFA